MFYFGEIAEFQSANAEVEENVGAVLRQLFSVRVQVLPPAAAVDKSCLFLTRESSRVAPSLALRIAAYITQQLQESLHIGQCDRI